MLFYTTHFTSLSCSYLRASCLFRFSFWDIHGGIQSRSLCIIGIGVHVHALKNCYYGMTYTSKCTTLDNCDSDSPQLHLHMYNQCMAYFLHHTTGAHNREHVRSAHNAFVQLLLFKLFLICMLIII